MKKLILLSAALVSLLSNFAFSQANQIFVPYLASGYKFLSTKPANVPSTFQNTGFDDSGWSTASAAVGTLNNTSSPPCPLNDAAHVLTTWKSSQDVLLRKHITLPAGTQNVRVSLEVDNNVQVFLNGTDISGGVQSHNDCAGPDNFVFNVPDNLLKVGDNVLAVHGIWISSKNYLDIRVKGDVNYLITASAGLNGSITPNGSVYVLPGGNQSFAITPSTGYHVAGVTVDGSSVGPLLTYTFSTVSANHTIVASFAINTYTLTASAGANGTISPSGSQTVNHGTSATYTITPATGYHIADVFVDNVSVGAAGTYSFSNISANHSISATFAINTYTLNASAGANGSITPSGAQTVNYGSAPSFIVTPNTGYHVADVLVDGLSVGAVPSYTFTSIASSHTISASFAINTYTLSASAGFDGSITPSGTQTVNYGSTPSFTITPATGYHVSDVLVDGGSVGPVSSYTFTAVSGNHTISASFAINTYILTVTAGSNGSISPSANQTVNYGSGTAFTITPNTGYHIADVLVDGSSVGAVASYAFSSVSSNHSIAVTFVINTYTIVASAGASGTISPTGSQNGTYGSSLAFTITPNTGYHVADVMIDSVSVGAVASYTFNGIAANHSIAASFAINTYTVSASTGANGSITPSGDQTVNYGSTPSFVIAPAIGYHIADVLVDNVSVGAVSSYQFASVSAGHVISASFAINTYTIAASSGPNGSLSSSGHVIVNYGSTQTFIIQALPGYHVESVVLDGTTNIISTQPTSQPGSTTWDVNKVTSDHSFSASFAENYYQLTLSFPPTLGTVAVEQPTTAPYPNYYKNGTVVTLRARTVDGYHFAGWTGVPSDNITMNPIDITMDSDKSISATFAQNVPLKVVVTTISDVVDPNDGKVSLREALDLVNSNLEFPVACHGDDKLLAFCCGRQKQG